MYGQLECGNPAGASCSEADTYALVSRNGQALAYDARSRLVSVSGSGAPPVRMGYDATGERARLERGASLSHFLGPDFEIRSIRPPTGTIRHGRRFAKTIRLGGTIVAVVESRTGLGASAPPSADSTRRWILVVGGAPAAVGLLLLALVLAQRRRLGLPLPQPALAGLVAVVFYLGPTGAALAAIPTGDLNADGALDGADVMLEQRIVDGTLTPNPVGDVAPLEQAPDGTIDSSDVLLLTRGAGEEDVDGDGLSDSAELADGTSPFRRDTDQDGVMDGAETGGGPTSARLNPDQDNDGIVDGEDALATTAAAPFEVLYVHADHLGGTAVATNDAGAVVRKVKYGIFGEVRGNAVETGAPATTPDPREKFTGQRYDAATALYYYGARYYDPALGRFIQADPIVPEPFDPQSLNRYAYVKNEPLTSVDPTGYYEEDAVPVCDASCELNWQIQRDLDAFRARPDPGYQGRTDLLGFQAQEHLPNYDASLNPHPSATTPPAASHPSPAQSPRATEEFNLFFGGGVVATAAGLGVGVGESSNVQYGRWRSARALKDGTRPFYDRRFHGNQFTGGRRTVVARGATFQLAGRMAFGVGAALSIDDAYRGGISPDQAGLDVFWSSVGTFGGPLGLLAAGAYFGSQYANQLFPLDPVELRLYAPESYMEQTIP